MCFWHEHSHDHMTRLKRDGKGLLRSLSVYEWMQCLQRPANVASSCRMFTARHCFLQRLTNPPSPHPTLYPVNMLKFQVVAVREPHLTLYTYLCVCLLFGPLSLQARIPGPRALKLTVYVYVLQFCPWRGVGLMIPVLVVQWHNKILEARRV